MDALRKDPSQYQTDPLQLFPGARELVAEFQDATDMTAGIAAGITDDDGVDADMDVTSFSSEDALDYILGAAIDRFGYSARDVFAAVFNYERTTTIHEEAFVLTPKQLEEAFSFLAGNQVTSAISHMIVTLSPICSNPYADDRWKMDFKSPWIARGVIQHIDVAERNSICRRILQRFPHASAVAGYFFEPNMISVGL